MKFKKYVIGISFLFSVVNILRGQGTVDYTESLRFSTIRIEAYTKTSLSTGTGFFFQLSYDNNLGKVIPVIVTNKHVVKGSENIRLFFRLADSHGGPEYGKPYVVTIKNDSNNIIQHPEIDIDLVAIPIMPIINQLKRKGINIYYIGLDEARIPNDSIQSLEFESVQEILMVGYPHGIWDSYNNLPIVRKGITATPSYIDYNGKKEFLVDIATFAGSSGSPVYVYRELWQPKKIGYAPKYGRSLFLVGIVRAMPVYNVDGKVSGDSSQIVHSNIPMNLAYVIKASKLADFKKLFTPDK